MNGWDPPQVGGTPQIPVTPVAPKQRWWKRKYQRVPAWGWAAGGLVAVAAVNEEWVRFGNGGSAPLDMTGWVVADDGPNHTYRFGQPCCSPTSS